MSVIDVEFFDENGMVWLVFVQDIDLGEVLLCYDLEMVQDMVSVGKIFFLYCFFVEVDVGMWIFEECVI